MSTITATLLASAYATIAKSDDEFGSAKEIVAEHNEMAVVLELKEVKKFKDKATSIQRLRQMAEKVVEAAAEQEAPEEVVEETTEEVVETATTEEAAPKKPRRGLRITFTAESGEEKSMTWSEAKARDFTEANKVQIHAPKEELSKNQREWLEWSENRDGAAEYTYDEE